VTLVIFDLVDRKILINASKTNSTDTLAATLRLDLKQWPD